MYLCVHVHQHHHHQHLEREEVWQGHEPLALLADGLALQLFAVYLRTQTMVRFKGWVRVRVRVRGWSRG